jgi:opacity protein-like surface antigen
MVLLALAFAVSLLSAAPATAQWSDLERWLDGSQPISLGVDTSRFRMAILGARPVIGSDEQSQDNTPYRLIDPDLRGTAVSLDLKLRSPSWAGALGTSALEPYLLFGPTLYLSDADTPRIGLPAARDANSMSLGVNVGAGLSWRLSRAAELFGSYRFMQSGREGIFRERSSSEGDFAGHDVLYGISVRF